MTELNFMLSVVMTLMGLLVVMSLASNLRNWAAQLAGRQSKPLPIAVFLVSVPLLAVTFFISARLWITASRTGSALENALLIGSLVVLVWVMYWILRRIIYNRARHRQTQDTQLHR